MEGELETIAEPVEPTIGEVEEQPVNLNDIEIEEGEPQPEPVDDDEEFDWEGKKVKGPKGLKDAVLRQADYTRKTQEVAEQRRALEQYAERITQQAKVSDAEIEARAALANVDARLREYQQVDWNAWEDSDPMAAQKAWREYTMLDKSREQYVSALTQTQHLRAQAAQQDFAKRVEETEAYARKNIKDWSPDVDKQVMDFARQKGIDQGFLRDHMQPLLYEILYKASLGERVLNAPARKPAAAPVQPLETVSARTNAPVRKSLSEMSMEEYAAARSKQMAASRR